MKLDSAVTVCTHEVEKYCLISKTKYTKIPELESQINLIIYQKLLYWNRCTIGDVDLHLFENVCNHFYSTVYNAGCAWNKKNL